MPNNLVVSIGKSSYDLQEYSTVLCAGNTGCGKSTLLKQFYQQLLEQNADKQIHFVFIDMKMIEFSKVRQSENILYPTAVSSDEVDRILDDLLNQVHEVPIIVFWDTYEDYLLSDIEGAKSKYRKLLLEASNRNIHIIASFSTARADDNIDLYSLKILGSWPLEEIKRVVPQEDAIRQIHAQSFGNWTENDTLDFRPGMFFVVNENKIRICNTYKSRAELDHLDELLELTPPSDS